MNRPAWTRRVHVGNRGSCLLFFGGLDLVYAWGMLAPHPPASTTNAMYRYVATLAPLQAWAVMWAIVGLTCIYHAFHRYDRYGFVAAIGVKVLWGTLALAGWFTSDVSVSSAGIWLGLAGLVWKISGWAEPLGTDHDAT